MQGSHSFCFVHTDIVASYSTNMYDEQGEYSVVAMLTQEDEILTQEEVKDEEEPVWKKPKTEPMQTAFKTRYAGLLHDGLPSSNSAMTHQHEQT